MQVYFIRHGETDYNAIHVHQPDSATLTENGRSQAAALREKVKRIRPTHLIASNQTRAVETAEIINAEGEYTIDFNPLFQELGRPRSIQGCKHFGLRSLWHIMHWFFGTNSSYWKKHGGENRAEFLSRVKKAKDFLETLPEDARVVVVSHSVFINFFLEHICNEAPISTYEAFLLLLKITKLDNAAVQHVSYNPDYGDGVCKWSAL